MDVESFAIQKATSIKRDPPDKQILFPYHIIERFASLFMPEQINVHAFITQRPCPLKYREENTLVVLGGLFW